MNDSLIYLYCGGQPSFTPSSDNATHLELIETDPGVQLHPYSLSRYTVRWSVAIYDVSRIQFALQVAQEPTFSRIPLLTNEYYDVSLIQCDTATSTTLETIGGHFRLQLH